MLSLRNKNAETVLVSGHMFSLRNKNAETVLVSGHVFIEKKEC